MSPTRLSRRRDSAVEPELAVSPEPGKRKCSRFAGSIGFARQEELAPVGVESVGDEDDPVVEPIAAGAVPRLAHFALAELESCSVVPEVALTSKKIVTVFRAISKS